MKLEKLNPHKRGKYVTEHPDYANNHVYLIRGQSHLDKGYKSTTTWLKQFFEEFDADGTIDKYYDKWQSANHPEYGGKSKDEIKEMWEKKRDDAATAGTHMHLQFEKFFNGEKTEVIDELPEFFEWVMAEGITPIRTEMTIYSPKYKIVGNVDLIAKDKNGRTIIVDYKRAEPKEVAYGRTCLGPMSKYPDHNGIKHALQLEIYKKIFEELYGYKIDAVYNLYIKEDGSYIYRNRDTIDNIDEILSFNSQKC